MPSSHPIGISSGMMTMMTMTMTMTMTMMLVVSLMSAFLVCCLYSPVSSHYYECGAAAFACGVDEDLFGFNHEDLTAAKKVTCCLSPGLPAPNPQRASSWVFRASFASFTVIRDWGLGFRV